MELAHWSIEFLLSLVRVQSFPTIGTKGARLDGKKNSNVASVRELVKRHSVLFVFSPNLPRIEEKVSKVMCAG